MIKENEVNLCHSPLKELVKSHKDKLVLATGVGKTEKILLNYGFTKFLTIQEYIALYKHTLPHVYRLPSISQQNKIVEKVQNRLNIKLKKDSNFKKHYTKQDHLNEIYEFLKIDSLFIMTDVEHWELSTQIFMDLLISKNGIPGNINSNYLRKSFKQYVDLHVASDDLSYKDEFVLNRIGAGCFLKCLNKIYYEFYNQNIKYTCYGKPFNPMFKYAKDKILKKDNSCETFYVIGDNPDVDIKGANNAGMDSILVQTGVWNKNKNCKENPGKYFVKNVGEAIDLIIKKHSKI